MSAKIQQKTKKQDNIMIFFICLEEYPPNPVISASSQPAPSGVVLPHATVAHL
jgi:hypothetical protein